MKERRLELAVQVADCGHDDDRGRISERAGSPVFILPLTPHDSEAGRRERETTASVRQLFNHRAFRR